MKTDALGYPTAAAGTMPVTTHAPDMSIMPPEINPNSDPLCALGLFQVRLTLMMGLVLYHGPMKSEVAARLMAKDLAAVSGVRHCKVIYHTTHTMARYSADGSVTEYQHI